MVRKVFVRVRVCVCLTTLTVRAVCFMCNNFNRFQLRACKQADRIAQAIALLSTIIGLCGTEMHTNNYLINVQLIT